MAMLLPALASAVAAAVPGPTFGNALAGLEICQGKPGQPDTTILNVRANTPCWRAAELWPF